MMMMMMMMLVVMMAVMTMTMRNDDDNENIPCQKLGTSQQGHGRSPDQDHQERGVKN